MVDIERAFLLAGPDEQLPYGKPLGYRSLPRFGKVMDEREHQMQFYRKSPVRRLHPVTAANSRYFFCESPLIYAATNVLDDGIAEHDIKRILLKRQNAAISRDAFHELRIVL
jgi:hypothetical protein